MNKKEFSEKFGLEGISFETSYGLCGEGFSIYIDQFYLEKDVLIGEIKIEIIGGKELAIPLMDLNLNEEEKLIDLIPSVNYMIPLKELKRLLKSEVMNDKGIVINYSSLFLSSPLIELLKPTFNIDIIPDEEENVAIEFFPFNNSGECSYDCDSIDLLLELNLLSSLLYACNVNYWGEKILSTEEIESMRPINLYKYYISRNHSLMDYIASFAKNIKKYSIRFNGSSTEIYIKKDNYILIKNHPVIGSLMSFRGSSIVFDYYQHLSENTLVLDCNAIDTDEQEIEKAFEMATNDSIMAHSTKTQPSAIILDLLNFAGDVILEVVLVDKVKDLEILE